MTEDKIEQAEDEAVAALSRLIFRCRSKEEMFARTKRIFGFINDKIHREGHDITVFNDDKAPQRDKEKALANLIGFREDEYERVN